MELFNVGLGELILIAIIALLVFGPERLPELARTAGRLLGQLRRGAEEVQRALHEETAPLRQPFDESRRDLQSLSQPLDEARQELAALTSQLNAVKQEIREAQASLKPTLLPPPTAPDESGSRPNGDVPPPRPYKPVSGSEVSHDNDAG